MTQEEYDVSIIIVNYNTWKMTTDCIDSVFKNTKDIAFEVIVVDNGSIDDSLNKLSHDARINYFYSKDNLGFGKANNLGYSKAKGRNILLLNSDTLLLNNAVKVLSDYLDAHNDVGACCGNLYDVNHAPTYSYCHNFPSIFRDFFTLFSTPLEIIRFGNSRFFNNSDKPIEVKHITGADLMIKRSVIEQIGLFDPAFFMYYEDTELCHRIYKRGYKLISIPSSQIVHLCGKSVLKSNSLLWNLEGRQLFFKLTGKSRIYVYIDYCLNRISLKVRRLYRLKDERKRAIFDECLEKYKYLYS